MFLSAMQYALTALRRIPLLFAAQVWPSWERGGILQPQYGLRANAIAFVRSLAERLHQLNAEVSALARQSRPSSLRAGIVTPRGTETGVQLVLVMAPSFADANSLASVQAATEFDELLRPASAHIRGCTLRTLSCLASHHVLEQGLALTLVGRGGAGRFGVVPAQRSGGSVLADDIRLFSRGPVSARHQRISTVRSHGCTVR
jgi:hypothetical protein